MTEILKYTVTVLFICVCQSYFNVNGYDMNDVRKLKTNLFSATDYDASFRPIFHQSDTLQVQVQLSLSAIVNLDMDNGMMDSTGYIVAQWQNEKLTWDPNLYGGLAKLNVVMAEIWHPEITQLDMVGEFASTTFAFVENTGMVTMVVNSELRSFCELNTIFYPRDKHVCTVNLYSAIYPSSEVSFVPLSGNVNLDNFKTHDKWIIDTTRAYTDKLHIADVNDTHVDINCLVIVIVVKRDPWFSRIHKVVPLILIAFINCFCHVIPFDSGERVSFSVTVFLALVFWEALVSDDIPHSSSLSFLSVGMTISLMQSTVSVVTSVIFSRMYVETDIDIPTLLRRYASFRKKSRANYLNKFKTRILCNRNDSEPNNETVGMSNIEDGVISNGGSDTLSNNEAICHSNINNGAISNGSADAHSLKEVDDVSTTIEDITWKEVTDALDEIFGIFSGIVVVLFVVALIVSYYYTDY